MGRPALEMGKPRQYLSGMVRSVARVLVAFMVVVAIAIPAGARVMPMVANMMPMSADMMGKMAGEPCQNCPLPHQSGGITPDKMPACPALACVTAPAVLPSPVLVPGRIAFKAEYAWPAAAGLPGADPAPDPFPPRPIVLL